MNGNKDQNKGQNGNKRKKQTEVPRYNMWQNTAFMLRQAWQVCKSVIFLCIAMAAVTAGQSVAQLLIVPVVLEKVELAAPFGQLVAAIAIFAMILMVLAGLKEYINTNVLFGRIEVRTHLITMISDKVAGTSYPNLLDTHFIDKKAKARDTLASNNRAGEAIWTTWTDILTNVAGFLVYLTILSNLNLLLACLVVGITAAGYAVNKKINEWGYRHREEEAAYDKKLDYLQRLSVQRTYAKDIRIFGLKGWLSDLWDSTIALYRDFTARKMRIYLWADVIDLMLTLLRNGIAYGYLIWLTLEQGLPASQFLLYFSAVSGFSQWVTGILSQFAKLHQQSLDLSVFREFLEWPEPFRFEGGIPLKKEPGQACEIRLEEVSFRYPEAEADTISHINLTIHPGEKLAIVGLNGAGKTTLVKLVCGFLDPTEGRVLLDGVDIRQYNRQDYYTMFQAVFQNFSVLETSVAENVAQRVEGIDMARVWECLEQAGLTEKIRSFPQGLDTKIGRQVYEDGVELSGGQLQRLMLARALYKDGPILVLDEPTAALDPIAENDIYMKYNEMTAGKTSLFISHRLASTRFCDRILFVEHGQIVEEGSHEELLERDGGYARLFEVQSQYYQEGEKDHGEQ